ncbi:hypothetical protein EV174_006880 [Coemansia sp. RSA 2320]|nr:hypothetical protein EV174_006880 [Coemansia sp. RSA 2320]
MYSGYCNPSPPDSPPELDAGYYGQQHSQRPHAPTPSAWRWSAMPDFYTDCKQAKKVTFAYPVATVTDVVPLSSSAPVELLSYVPRKSAMANGATHSPPHEACEYQEEGSDYGLAAYIELKQSMRNNQQQQQQQQQQQYQYQHRMDSQSQVWQGHKDSTAKRSEHDESASGRTTHRRKRHGSEGQQAGAAAAAAAAAGATDAGAQAYGQYRYDKRFSLSMEHLPLHHQSRFR